MAVVKAATPSADQWDMLATPHTRGRRPSRGRSAGRRQGLTVVYFLVAWAALIGFVSLAVDFGRVQLDKAQLQCVADAAARAGLFNLSSGLSVAQSAAVNVAAANTVDGSAVTLVLATDFAVGYWDPVGQTFTAATTPALQASANSVQVTARRTAATGNPVPLLIAGILGRTGCDVRSTAVACQAANVPLVNPNFEQPALGSGQYIYDEAMPGWTLTGSACLATYGSAWTMPQPQGNQAIAMQGLPGSTLANIEQTFPTVAGTYQVSLLAAQRSYHAGSTGLQPVTVSIDGAQIATISPTSTTFAPYSTATFVLATGSHSLQMAATDNSADHTTFVDQVTITSTGATPVLLAH